MFDYDSTSDREGDIYSLTGYAEEVVFDEVMDTINYENNYFDDDFLDVIDEE